MKIKRSIKTKFIGTILVAVMAFSMTVNKAAFAQDIVKTWHGYTGVITITQHWWGKNFNGSTYAKTNMDLISVSIFDSTGRLNGATLVGRKSVTCTPAIVVGTPYGMHSVNDNGATHVWFTNHAQTGW